MNSKFKTITGYSRVVCAAVTTMAMTAIPSVTHAMDWYGGLSYGEARAETTGGDLLGDGFSGTVDGNHSGWKALAGMSLWGKYVAAEFGYADLGQASAKGTVSGSTSSAISKAKAYTAALAGLVPMSDQFGVILRLGLSGSQVFVATTGPLGAGASPTQHVSDLKLFGGLGLQYDFSKTMGARVEVERFNMGSVGSPYINLLTAGLVYRFGQ